MVLYIAGRISDHTTLESGFRSEFNLTDFRSAFAANYGGVYTDYYIYQDSETSSDSLRIKNGDDWIAVWTGDAITGISFATEDAKKWIDVSIDRTSFMADNSESVLLKASVLLANKSGVDTAFDGNIDIPVHTSEGSRKLRFRFISGKASRAVTTTVAGIWRFPAIKVSGYRNNNSATFESIQ